ACRPPTGAPLAAGLCRRTRPWTAPRTPGTWPPETRTSPRCPGSTPRVWVARSRDMSGPRPGSRPWRAPGRHLSTREGCRRVAQSAAASPIAVLCALLARHAASAGLGALARQRGRHPRRLCDQIRVDLFQLVKRRVAGTLSDLPQLRRREPTLW